MTWKKAVRIVGPWLLAVLAAAPQSAVARADCSPGTPSTGGVVYVKGQGHELRVSPDAKATRVVNEKATKAVGATEYHKIDSSEQVRVDCVFKDWTKIQVIKPDYLIDVGGWVRTTALGSPATGARTLSAEDIQWDEQTSRHKQMIVKVLNRIQQEDSRCTGSLDPGTVTQSPTKSTKAKPVFFVTCGTDMSVVNVFFSADDLAASEKMTAPVHISHARAVERCEAEAKSKAAHPSTVSFSQVLDLAITDHPNGRTTVFSSFTAKNSFNLELKYRIKCLLSSGGLIEATISEAGQ